MKAFFQRLSNQIDKSDIPDGGPSQTTSPVTEVEPDETQILKDAIAKLQQDLDESNSKVQSQNSEIDKLKQAINNIQGVDLSGLEAKIEGIIENKIRTIVDKLVLERLEKLEQQLIDKIKADLDLNKVKSAVVEKVSKKKAE